MSQPTDGPSTRKTASTTRREPSAPPAARAGGPAKDSSSLTSTRCTIRKHDDTLTVHRTNQRRALSIIGTHPTTVATATEPHYTTAHTDPLMQVIANLTHT